MDSQVADKSFTRERKRKRIHAFQFSRMADEEMTELRLGLPGVENNVKKKRQFSELTPGAAGVGNETSCSDEAAWGAKNANVVRSPPVCSYQQKRVKVSMDGVPYSRKIDLNTYKRYSDLSIGLKKLFGRFRIHGPVIGTDSKYITTYVDKDGDWMLVGDLPWEMFTDSCRRLRIMKRSEANGLKAEAAVERVADQPLQLVLVPVLHLL